MRAIADVIERALYNGINSGMSLDGTLYCYRNPLAFDPPAEIRFATNGTTLRAVRRISNALLLLSRDISTAPAATDFTCISTTIPSSIGTWKTAPA